MQYLKLSTSVDIHTLMLNEWQLSTHLSYDWVISRRHFVKDTANSLQTFLILGRYSVVLFVIKLQWPTLHSDIQQRTSFLNNAHKI